jgi:hypothetical protein
MTTVDNYTFARAFLQLEQALRVDELDPRLVFEGKMSGSPLVSPLVWREEPKAGVLELFKDAVLYANERRLFLNNIVEMIRMAVTGLYSFESDTAVTKYGDRKEQTAKYTSPRIFGSAHVDNPIKSDHLQCLEASLQTSSSVSYRRVSILLMLVQVSKHLSS